MSLPPPFTKPCVTRTVRSHNTVLTYNHISPLFNKHLHNCFKHLRCLLLALFPRIMFFLPDPFFNIWFFLYTKKKTFVSNIWHFWVTIEVYLDRGKTPCGRGFHLQYNRGQKQSHNRVICYTFATVFCHNRRHGSYVITV